MAQASDEKNEIARLRRRANRLGLRVWSSRHWVGSINNHGGYMIVNDRDLVVAGDRFDLTLGDVAEWIEREEREAA